MKKILIAALLSSTAALLSSIAPTAVFAQAATNNMVVAPPGKWTDLGAGPMVAQVLKGTVLMGSIATACPANNGVIAGAAEIASQQEFPKVLHWTTNHICVQGVVSNGVVNFYVVTAPNQ